MKKICIVLLLLAGSFTAQSAPLQSMQTRIGGIAFRIDKRIELYYTLAWLANYPFLNGLEIEYKERIEKYFAPYRDHEAITQFREAWSETFASIDAPIFLLLSLDERLEWIARPSQVTNPEAAERFRLLLESFARESDFDGFYRQNHDLYQAILSTIEFNFTDFDTRNMLEEYYGPARGKEFVIVLNLLGSGNFGPQLTTSKGTTGYCLIEPVARLGNIPGFAPDRQFQGMAFHEFSHTYITPLVERYEAQIRESEHLFGPICESMTSQGYDNWITTVNEHITRAVTCRLAARKYGEESARLTEYRLELARRFIYVEPLIEKLKEYEASRGQYQTFEEFFPELLTVFTRITPLESKKYQSHTEQARTPRVERIPGFFAALETHSADLVFIRPTAEESAQGAEKLTEFIEDFARRFPGAEIITDTEALERDLSQKSLAVFGTPWGNLFLKQYVHQLPVSVGRDRIVVGKEYAGEGYQLMAGWVNPMNSDMPMAIYTAQKPELVAGMNTILPGAGFTLARDYKVLRSGEYVRLWQSWMIGD